MLKSKSHDRESALARIEQRLAFVDTADEFAREYADPDEPVQLLDLALAMGTRLGSFGGRTCKLDRSPRPTWCAPAI